MTPTGSGRRRSTRRIGRAFVAMCAVVPALALHRAHRPAARRPARRAGRHPPRDSSGLDGLLLAPLVHDGWEHLFLNSAPLVLLGTFVLAAGTRRFLLVHAVHRHLQRARRVAVHAAAVPGDRGQRRDLRLARPAADARASSSGACGTSAVALVVGLLYGWQLVALLPTDQRISWQGHLFGFVGGLAAAIVFRRRREPGGQPAPHGHGSHPTPAPSRTGPSSGGCLPRRVSTPVPFPVGSRAIVGARAARRPDVGRG